jgi:hypothetical protein
MPINSKETGVLLVTDIAWKKIRELFSEAEKAALRKAIANDVLCPPGIYLDRARIAPELLAKLCLALNTRAPEGK